MIKQDEPGPSSKIALDHFPSTSSSLPINTRHRRPVKPMTSASNALRISIFAVRASLTPLYQACIRMALSVRCLCCARAWRSACTWLRMLDCVATDDTPPRFIFRFRSSPNAGSMLNGVGWCCRRRLGAKMRKQGVSLILMSTRDRISNLI